MKAKDKILIAAQAIFYRQGMQKPSIKSIYEDAGVSKMTFYRLFKDKEDLARAVMEDILESSFAEYLQVMTEDIPFKEKLEQILLLKMQKTEGLSSLFYEEVMKNAQIAPIIQQHSQKQYQQFIEDLEKGKQEGAIKEDFNPHQIIYLIQYISKLADDPAYQQLFTDIQQMTKATTEFLFFGIAGGQK